MTDRVSVQIEHTWHELRDERGRLYARLDSSRYVLEVSYHRERVTFDLRDYLDILRDLDHRQDIE